MTKSNHNTTPAMTVADVAACLGVTDKTIRREITRGKLKVVHVGTALRITQEALDVYMALNK
jgi:excisionase family DNA binding protein